jgi:hypothetical protein
MNCKYFLFLVLIFNAMHADWTPLDLNTAALGTIIELAFTSPARCYALGKASELEKERLYYRIGSTWKLAPALPADIVSMKIDRDSLLLLTNSEPARLIRFFNNQYSLLHEFGTKQPITNFLPFNQDILVINHGVIRILNAMNENIWHLSALLNVSDFAFTNNNSLWAVQKEIIGQGRQTTLFIKLREWNEKTHQWKLHAQQVGPRIFRLANGVSKDLWSLQGDSPRQLFAYRFDTSSNTWHVKGKLKGLKLLSVAQDGTVWAVHHNNTIYEWREN